MRPLIAAILLVTFTACATVQHGPVQRIPVDSEPQGALVRTSHCGPGATKETRTPGEVWVSRRAEHCTLTFTARDHYAEQVVLRRAIAEEFFENADAAAVVLDGGGEWLPWFLFGTLVGATGFAVDTATGALFEQHPHEVYVNLERVGTEPQEQASRER